MFGFGKKKQDQAVNSPEAEPDSGNESLFERLRSSLKKTRSNLGDGLANLLSGKKAIDEDLLEELESLLLTADIGIDATTSIIDDLTSSLKRNQLQDSGALYEALQGKLLALLEPCERPLEIPRDSNKPFVILMVGVNGVGKTTTIGKLASKFQNEKRSVMLAAGDTFRAAAVEQLQVWGDRHQVPVVAQHTGADSASVIYDAYQSAVARKIDVLIADTAGRLHNKDNLMQELEKVIRVLKKLDENIPQEVMLVLDAGTGQNGLSQAEHFKRAVDITGLTLTKLDGTAKGGMIFAIAEHFGLPIRFIGIGENSDDLRPFSAQDFVMALFDQGQE
ncbi:MAG: signal recognition particle-docking protein FtsY [Gammaproteobacteria bacterium]|jgi:fused signal recognition particle receptor|nr:signal recognition particle-docking protein FtsY [Gammaproteobacteria bacterium]